MAGQVTKKNAALPPAALQVLFANPPLLGSESRNDYDNLKSAMIETLQPQDAIFWMLLNDIVDITWEIRRYGRMEVAYFKQISAEVVLQCLMAVNIGANSKNISTIEAKAWAAGGASRDTVQAKLSKCGYDADRILAKTYLWAGTKLEIFHRRIETCERRRMFMLREIDRRNAAVARTVHDATRNFIEGDYTKAAE